MGQTFGSIQIYNYQRLTSKQMANALAKYLLKQDMMPANEEDAQHSFKLAFSENGNWISLYTRDWEGMTIDVIKPFAKELAKALKTCAIGISVFDSDNLFLYLYDAPAKRDDLVAMGSRDDIEEMFGQDYESTRGHVEYWMPHLVSSSTESLSALWREEFVFVEEVLPKMAELFGSEGKNFAAEYRYWEEVEPDNPNIVTLHFKTSAPVFVKDGLTKLVIQTSPVMVSGQSNVVTLYNIGGVSEGLTIAFQGNSIEAGEVEISNVSVEKRRNPKNKTGDWLEFMEIVDIELQKRKSPDEKLVLRGDLDGFVFPKGINPEHPSMRGVKGMDTISAYSIILRFTATICSDASKAQFGVAIVPQQNWKDGQTGRSIEVYRSFDQIRNAFESKELR